MSESDPKTNWVDKADGKSLPAIILMIIGAPLLALGQGASEAVYAIFGIITGWASSISDAISDYITAFASDPATAFGDVVTASADAITSGIWGQYLGPLAMPVFALLVILTAYELLWFLDYRDSDIPLTGIDVPLVGNAEAGEEE